jgi:hypothetical protein
VGVVVSPGADAAACGLHDGGVVCWGEGYSPAHAPGTPVRVALGALPARDTAVVGPEDPSGWSATCLVRRGCTRAAPALPKCETAGAPTQDVAATIEADASLSGEVVRVTGRVGVGAAFMSAVGCRASDGRGCCNEVVSSVVVSDGTTRLPLEGLFCSGDDSAQCCNAPALGQPVIASGRLELAKGAPTDSPWHLVGVTVCEP